MDQGLGVRCRVCSAKVAYNASTVLHIHSLALTRLGERSVAGITICSAIHANVIVVFTRSLCAKRTFSRSSLPRKASSIWLWSDDSADLRWTVSRIHRNDRLGSAEQNGFPGRKRETQFEEEKNWKGQRFVP